MPQTAPLRPCSPSRPPQGARTVRYSFHLQSEHCIHPTCAGTQHGAPFPTAWGDMAATTALRSNGRRRDWHQPIEAVSPQSVLPAMLLPGYQLQPPGTLKPERVLPQSCAGGPPVHEQPGQHSDTGLRKTGREDRDGDGSLGKCLLCKHEDQAQTPAPHKNWHWGSGDRHIPRATWPTSLAVCELRVR